jgi:hypothetical protein
MGSDTGDGASVVRSVMERYVKAVYHADVDTLRGLFHPRASMSGYLGDDLLVDTPEPFFADLGGRPSMAASGHPYQGIISNVEVMGRAATATLVEHGFFGVFSFVNYYHLLDIEGQWKIVSKTFSPI